MAVIRSMARFMAAYFTDQPLYIFPPHNVDILHPLHIEPGIFLKSSLIFCVQLLPFFHVYVNVVYCASTWWLMVSTFLVVKIKLFFQIFFVKESVCLCVRLIFHFLIIDNILLFNVNSLWATDLCKPQVFDCLAFYIFFLCFEANYQSVILDQAKG